MPVFLFLFIVMPILELVVLIQVGTVIGALNTIGLVLLTAIIGAALLKKQGLATLTRANQRMNSGEIPAREMAEGLILAFGGAMLLAPGFITDAFGFLCLLPGTRHWLVSQAMKRMVVRGQSSGFFFTSGQGGPFGGGTGGGHGGDPFSPRRGPDGDIIEGDYRDETDRGHDRIEKK